MPTMRMSSALQIFSLMDEKENKCWYGAQCLVPFGMFRPQVVRVVGTKSPLRFLLHVDTVGIQLISQVLGSPPSMGYTQMYFWPLFYGLTQSQLQHLGSESVDTTFVCFCLPLSHPAFQINKQ